MNDDIQPKHATLKRSRAWVPLLTLLGAVVVSLLAWREYASILRLAAYRWAISDTLSPADAVVVLGGGSARPYAAAQLYRSGLASRILLDDDYDRKVMLTLDIRPPAFEVFGTGLKNTYEEACALVDWAKKNDARRIIIPTELFPSRRVRWIFDRKLEGLEATVMIDVLPIPEITADNWWLSEAGRDQFLSEIAKYFYYRVRYVFSRC